MIATQQRASECQVMQLPPSPPRSPDFHPMLSSGFHSNGLEMKIDLCHSSFEDDTSMMATTPAIDSLLPERRVVKRPAESQIPDELASEKRKLSDHVSTLKSELQLREADCRSKDVIIDRLRQDLEKSRNSFEQLSREHRLQTKEHEEEVAQLKYENDQMKVYTGEISNRHTVARQEDRVACLEAELVMLKRKLSERDMENARLKAKVAKLDEDYIRLAEEIILDPADDRNEFTFCPINEQDEHQCINPNYNESCVISNSRIGTTAEYFAVKCTGKDEPRTKLDSAVDVIVEEQQRKDVPQTASWFSKKAKKTSKWQYLPSIPGNHVDQCAAVEHAGRFYVAATVSSSATTSRSPTPTPQVTLFVFNEKDRKFVNLNIPPPIDAMHPTGLFSYESHLYLVTAQDGGDSIWSYEPKRNSCKQWSFVSATVNGETACAVCMYEEHLILAGGAKKDGNSTSCNTVKSFSVKDTTWNHGWPLMKNARHASRLVHVNHHLYVLGGGVGSKIIGFDTMHTVEKLSLARILDGWKPIGKSEEFAPAVVSIGSSIVTAGGLMRGQKMTALPCCSRMQDSSSGVVRHALPDLQQKRSAACIVTFNDRLYCIGGCVDQHFTGAVEELSQE